MDLGNLNLRLLTPPAGEEGGAKGGRKNAGEVPAEGGFAAIIASLLSAARGEAKPAGDAVPVQPRGLLAKGAAAQTLAAAETVSLQPEAGGAPESGMPSRQQLQAPPLQTVPPSNAAPAVAATAAGEAAHPGQERAAFFNALLRNGAAETANDESSATIKPQGSGEATPRNNPAAAPKAASAVTGPGVQELANDPLNAQARAVSAAERGDLAPRETSASAAPAGHAPAGAETAAGRAPAATAPQASQSIVAQLAQQLTYAARGGMQHLRFQLHPAELGQVSIQLRIRDGAAKVVISADNPAAVETMRQAAGALHQSLQAAGVQLDREHLSFQQQGGGGDHFASGDEAGRGSGRGAPDDHGGAGRGETGETPEPAADKSGLFL